MSKVDKCVLTYFNDYSTILTWVTNSRYSYFEL